MRGAIEEAQACRESVRARLIGGTVRPKRAYVTVLLDGLVIDPQASLPHRCEREAKQRWGLVNSGAQLVECKHEEALKVAPVLTIEEEEQLRPSVQQALYRLSRW